MYSIMLNYVYRTMSRGEEAEFVVHPAFHGAGEKVGFEVWRIEVQSHI